MERPRPAVPYRTQHSKKQSTVSVDEAIKIAFDLHGTLDSDDVTNFQDNAACTDSSSSEGSEFDGNSTHKCEHEVSAEETVEDERSRRLRTIPTLPSPTPECSSTHSRISSSTSSEIDTNTLISSIDPQSTCFRSFRSPTFESEKALRSLEHDRAAPMLDTIMQCNLLLPWSLQHKAKAATVDVPPPALESIATSVLTRGGKEMRLDIKRRLDATNTEICEAQASLSSHFTGVSHQRGILEPLARWCQTQQEVRVITRQQNFSHKRILYYGKIAVFDKHWSLVLLEVKEHPLPDLKVDASTILPVSISSQQRQRRRSETPLVSTYGSLFLSGENIVAISSASQ